MYETERLLLVPLTYEQVVKYAKCDHSLEAELKVNNPSAIISPELKEALENTILPALADQANNYPFATLWTAIDKLNNHMIGDLCIIGDPHTNGDMEIGYGTHEAFQGKGYMTEFVGGIVAWANTQPIIRAITASTEKMNTASITVLERNHFLSTGESDTHIFWKVVL